MISKKYDIYLELPIDFIKDIFENYEGFFDYHCKITKPTNIIFEKDYKGNVLNRFTYMNELYAFERTIISERVSKMNKKSYDIKVLFNNEIVLATNYYKTDITSTIARTQNLPYDEVPFGAPFYRSVIDKNYQIFKSSIWVSNIRKLKSIFNHAERDLDESLVRDFDDYIQNDWDED